MIYLSILVSGFGGGVLRGLVGFIKHQYSYKKVGFDTKYFLMTSFVSGIIGILSSLATSSLLGNGATNFFSPAMAFVIGYAGGDFLENIYKIIAKKIEAKLPK